MACQRLLERLPGHADGTGCGPPSDPQWLVADVHPCGPGPLIHMRQLHTRRPLRSRPIRPLRVRVHIALCQLARILPARSLRRAFLCCRPVSLATNVRPASRGISVKPPRAERASAKARTLNAPQAFLYGFPEPAACPTGSASVTSVARALPMHPATAVTRCASSSLLVIRSVCCRRLSRHCRRFVPHERAHTRKNRGKQGLTSRP